MRLATLLLAGLLSDLSMKGHMHQLSCFHERSQVQLAGSGFLLPGGAARNSCRGSYGLNQERGESKAPYTHLRCASTSWSLS